MAENKNGSGKVNKMESMRQAMAALGNDAPTADLQKFLKEHFGLDMPGKLVSTYRGDILKKAAQKARPVGRPPAATTAEGGKLTRIEAVRQAVEALGKKASRPDLQSYLKAEFGIEISLDHISNCKAELARRKKRKKGKKAAQAAPAAQPHAAEATPRAGGGNGTSPILVEDVLAVKGLVRRVGAEHLRTLIDAFAK